MKKDLSLIILTYNSEKDIYDCLQSVYQHNDIGDALEIIVVDNNSTHYAEMQRTIQSLYPDITIIANTSNGGYGQGNNVGITAATSPIICIMNPDVRLIMPVFKEMLHTLNQEDNILCGGKQYVALNKPSVSISYDHHAPAIMQSIGNLLRRKYDKYDYRHMWLSGAFFAIRKKEFEQIGLFDERIFMYGEEFDIHLRIRKHMPHKKIKYLPQLQYLHLMEERVITKEYIYKQLLSDIRICERHAISARLCLRRKIRALKINLFIHRLLCWSKSTSTTTHAHTLQLNVLKELYETI
jgi:GT2 family glycosyltransferase